MATVPMPKTRSLVQTGRKPRQTNEMKDPDAAVHQAPIVRTLVGDRAGAVPGEAYQYDLVYQCFANDEAFHTFWKVPKNGFARCSTEESISQKNSYIRVVMDLHPECKLYPTAYTPGFATVPRDISDAELQRTASMAANHAVPGLPEGYSVALDVYILKDAEILLKHQRAFRGRVDAAYRWLDAIINPGMGSEETLSGELALMQVSPQDNTIMQAPQAISNSPSGGSSLKNWSWQSMHGPNSIPGVEKAIPGAALPPGGYGGNQLALGSDGSMGRNPNPKALQSLHEVLQPAARETLPLSCLNACPRGLATDPSLDDAGRQLQDFRKEIHTENALINAFGGHVGLPMRDTGTSWGTAADDGAAVQKKKQLEDETAQLDRALQKLWSRTVETADAAEDEYTTV